MTPAIATDQTTEAANSPSISTRTLNAAGRRRDIALFFAEHFLGEARFERLLGGARRRNRDRMFEFFKDTPTNRRIPVPEATLDSHEDFFRAHQPCVEPVVFRGCATAWPAAEKWSLDYFAEHFSDTQCVMTDHVGLAGEQERGKYSVSNIGELAAAVRAGEKPYLRFSPVIKQTPELEADLDMKWLEGFRTAFSLRGEPQLFVGPESTATPLHCALESNIFVQLSGKKRWLLYPARYQSMLGVRAERLPYFHSRFDPDAPSGDFPIAPHAPAYEVVLDAGDVMYVPPFVWHTVENLTSTIAVGYRYNCLRAAAKSSWPMMILRFLATRPSILHTLYYSITQTNFLFKPPVEPDVESKKPADRPGSLPA